MSSTARKFLVIHRDDLIVKTEAFVGRLLLLVKQVLGLWKLKDSSVHHWTAYEALQSNTENTLISVFMYSFCLISSTIHWLKTWQIHDRLSYTSSTSVSNHQHHHPWSSQENLLYHCHTLHCMHCGNINTSWSITQLTWIPHPQCSKT